MHDSAQGRGSVDDRIAVGAGPSAPGVIHMDRVRERVSVARSRELVIARLLARGISAATLRALLPERRSIIDRLAA